MSPHAAATPAPNSNGHQGLGVPDQVTPLSSLGSSRRSETTTYGNINARKTSNYLPSVASFVRTGLRSGAGTMTRGLSWHIRATMKLELPEPDLFRGAPVANALRGFASVLSSREPTAGYFDLSAPLDNEDPNELVIDTFISHNWDTPRWKKFLVLVLHFNLKPAILISLCVAACVAGLAALGVLPHVNAKAEIAKEMHYSTGIVSLPAGVVTFLLTLLSFHELDKCRFVGKPHTLFLDKVCVHQKDSERKRKGIQALAAFLDRSKGILVLYSDIYLQKLWTCYEAAAWLMLHKGEKMIVRPMSGPPLVLSAFACAASLELVVFVVNHFDLYALLRDVPGFVVVGICLMPFLTFGAWLVARWADDHDRIENHVQSFCLADARCASEEDRALVKQSIVDFMRFAKICDRKLPDEEIFDRFEQLVRREVPKLLWSSFGRVSVPYAWALVIGLPHAFFTLDFAAGMRHRTRHHREELSVVEAVLRCAYHAAGAFLLCPLTLAFMVMLTRLRRLRGLGGCLLVAALSVGLLLAYLVTYDHIVSKAAQSTGWFFVVLAGWAALILATAVAYRPLRLGRAAKAAADAA